MHWSLKALKHPVHLLPDPSLFRFPVLLLLGHHGAPHQPALPQLRSGIPERVGDSGLLIVDDDLTVLYNKCSRSFRVTCGFYNLFYNKTPRIIQYCKSICQLLRIVLSNNSQSVTIGYGSIKCFRAIDSLLLIGDLTSQRLKNLSVKWFTINIQMETLTQWPSKVASTSLPSLIFPDIWLTLSLLPRNGCEKIQLVTVITNWKQLLNSKQIRPWQPQNSLRTTSVSVRVWVKMGTSTGSGKHPRWMPVWQHSSFKHIFTTQNLPRFCHAFLFYIFFLFLFLLMRFDASQSAKHTITFNLNSSKALYPVFSHMMFICPPSSRVNVP